MPVTVAGWLRREAPETVLAVDRALGAPPDARADAARLKQVMGDPLQPGWVRRVLALRTDGRLERLRADAAAVLQRDPTAIEAVTALGLTYVLAGDMARADRAFFYADRLSRRDISAQTWLIQRAVQRNDVAGALRHYDTVLRVSPPMAAQLFPVLVQAIRVPEIAVALNRLLRTRPNWGDQFLTVLLRAPADARSAYLATRGLVGPDGPARTHLTALLRALTTARAYDLAWRAYVAAWPARGRSPALLWNGDFSEDPGAPPFDWGFADDPALAAERRNRDGDDAALFLPPGANAETDVARQLVRLAPGSYRLNGMAGDVPDDEAVRPLVAIACAGQDGPALARQDLPTAPAAGRSFSVGFAVPAGCGHQWVSIRVRGSFDRQLGVSPWVDSLAIVRN